MEERLKQPGMVSGQTTQDADQGEMEINLVELLIRLLEKWKIIAMAAILGAVIAGAITFGFITPTYTATSKLYVLNGSNSLLNLSDFQLGNYLATDYQEVFITHEVQEAVIDQLNLEYTPEKLEKMITIFNPNNTRILYISCDSKDPQEACDIANTFAAVAQAFIEDRMDSKQPSLFSEAVKPEKPSAPNNKLNVALGFVLGLLIACGAITVLFIADDRIRTREDIEKYMDIPTLGMMPLNKDDPYFAKKNGHKNKKASAKGGSHV